MEKLRLDLDSLAVETFAATVADSAEGVVEAHEATCSKQPTCGIASRGPETYELENRTLYACCV